MDNRYLALVLNDNDTYTAIDDCTLRIHIADSDDDNNGIPTKNIIADLQSPNADTLIIYLRQPLNIEIVQP